MEAEAVCDFQAEHPDQMSVRRGERLCVVNPENTELYRAFTGTQSGYVPASCVRLKPHDWYQASVTRDEARKLLLQTNSRNVHILPEGAFIIRNSGSDRNKFALSVKHEGGIEHFMILKDSENRFYIWSGATFFSINELVDKYHTLSVSGALDKHICLCDIHSERFEALYNYSPASEEEVELKKGDIIRLVARTEQNWWEGVVGGRVGFFPKSYVQVYQP